MGLIRFGERGTPSDFCASRLLDFVWVPLQKSAKKGVGISLCAIGGIAHFGRLLLADGFNQDL